MKVILYIGHHKVGSTALQVFLSQNAQRLLRHGILYPFTEMQGAAHALALANGIEVGNAEQLPVNIREPHSALAYRLMADTVPRPVPPQFVMLPHSGQMMHAVRNQIVRLKPRCVIFCSEAFVNFGAVDPDLVTRFCAQFPEATFQIYCALRRPDEYVVSWHGQRIKVGETVDALSEHGGAPYFDTIHFNYRLALQAWLERCPAEDVQLRNYSDILAEGGSAVDFVKRADIDFPDDLLPVRQANKSLPHAVTEIARRANHRLERADSQRLSQFLLTTDTLLDLPANGQVEMLGAQARARLLAEFRPVHDYLCEVTGRSAFFPDLEDIATPRPIPEEEAVRGALRQMTESVTAAIPSAAAREFLGHLRGVFHAV